MQLFYSNFTMIKAVIILKGFEQIKTLSSGTSIRKRKIHFQDVCLLSLSMFRVIVTKGKVQVIALKKSE